MKFFFQDLLSQQKEQNKTIKIPIFQMKSRTKIKKGNMIILPRP